MNKLGCVPFLNVRPLVYAIENNLVKHGFELTYAPPSALSKMLSRKEVDLGLIPAAELIRAGIYRVVPNISISSYGKVDSAILMTKSELKDIKTIVADVRSQSTFDLLRIFLEVFNKISPTYLRKEPTENGFFSGVDGVMLIGDTALKLRYFPPVGYRIFDLGEIWTSEMGLPYVYAVYAVNEGVKLGENLNALEMSRSLGLKMVEKISKIESERVKLSEGICLRYLTERIKYDLGEKEVKAILTHADFLTRLGELKKVPEVRIYSE